MKYHIKVFVQKMIAILIFPIRLFPVKPGRILFLSLEGGSLDEYSCNPKYICEYFLKHPTGKHELVWLFRNPALHADLKEKGIVTGKHFTPKGVYYALTSETVITNGGYLTWFPFRRSQTVINTWHGGGAYKKLENDMRGANHASMVRMQHAAKNTDLFLSSSGLFTEHVIRGAFSYRGEVMSCGMPRNDCLLNASETTFSKDVLLEKLNLPENAKLLLYAPTFRGDEAKDFLPLQVNDLYNVLNSAGQDKWYILYRSHLHSHAAVQIEDPDGRCINVSAFPDTQELLFGIDMMITDYSSIVWDFCLTDKPLYLYTPDYETYTADRGFYLDMEKWGYPLCRTMESLLAEIRKQQEGVPFTASKYHRELLDNSETGQASKAVYDYIVNKAKGNHF